MREEPPTLSAAILDESIELTLVELCRACTVQAQQVTEMVEQGLLEPHGGTPDDWRFSGIAIWRVQTALRLQRDLEINLAGAALVVELLEELRELRQRMRLLERGSP